MNLAIISKPKLKLYPEYTFIVTSLSFGLNLVYLSIENITKEGSQPLNPYLHLLLADPPNTFPFAVLMSKSVFGIPEHFYSNDSKLNPSRDFLSSNFSDLYFGRSSTKYLILSTSVIINESIILSLSNYSPGFEESYC